MKAGEKQQPDRAPWVALAGILALSLSACGGDRPAAETAATDIAEPLGAKFKDVPERPAVLAAEAEPDISGPKAGGPPIDESALGARVKSALRMQPGLKALSIDVDAASGAVTLYGTANTPAQREVAGQLALGVDGVKSVTNHLIILKET